MINICDKRIVVTGGAGFLGSWVVKRLEREEAKQIFVPRSKDYDLRDKTVCDMVLKNQDILIHIAAHVGGIGLNKAHPGQMFYDNASMGIHLLEAARQQNLEKILIIGTACAYPKYCPAPFTEEDFWSGYPDEITGVYGLAKKILLVQAQAYRQEYGTNAIYLILVNLYGPGDNFDPLTGHVIPSLVYRMVQAKAKKKNKFTVWGSGTATREFIYVEDAAEGIVKALKYYDEKEPVNLGTGKEISVRDLVMMIKKTIGFTGKIVWDPSKPDGQPRRVVDTTRAREKFNFSAKTSLEEGLGRTIAWYLSKENKF